MDVTYTIAAVRRGYRYRAARLAVFTPLLGNWQRRKVADLLERLQREHRDRLGAYHNLLRGTDEPLGRLRELQYARNCPPFGVDFERGRQSPGRTCCRHLLCPFCWARLVAIEAYFRFEDLCWGSTDPEAPRLVPAEARLVRVVETRRPHVLDGCWDDEALELAVKAAVRVIREPRGRLDGLTELGPTLGSMVLHTLSPTRKDLILRRHTLAVVPQPVRLPTFERQHWVIRRDIRPVDRKTLAHVVGRACAFPPGMFRGKPLSALLVAGCLRRVRCLAFRKARPAVLNDLS